MTASDEANQRTGIDFRDRDLRGQDFSSQDLRNADFTGADLRNCSFQGANLSRADFTSAKIGVSSSSVCDLLWRNGWAIIFVVLIVSISILSESDFLGCLFGWGKESSDEPEKSTKPIDKSYVSIWLVLFFSAAISAGLGVYCLLFKNVNADSILVVDLWMGSFLSLIPVILGMAIITARDLARTNFSNANLDLAKIDRASFKQAKSVGVEVDRINWQD